MNNDEQLAAKRPIDELLVWYENQPWLRAVVQAVPLAGSSMDTLLAWRATYLSKQRVQELFRNVSDRLSSVEASALNVKFLESETFFELLQSCAETVAKTASEYKRKRVADFLAGTIKAGCAHDLSQQIAEDIKVLQELHLQILTHLPDEESTFIEFPKLKESTGISDTGILSKGLSDLERLGFLRRGAKGITFAGEMKAYITTKYLNIFRQSLAA